MISERFIFSIHGNLLHLKSYLLMSFLSQTVKTLCQILLSGCFAGAANSNTCQFSFFQPKQVSATGLQYFFKSPDGYF